MPGDTAKIISSLEIVRQKNPGLTNTIDLHCALLKAQDQVRPVCPFGSPTAAEAEQALRQGTPLLRLGPLFFDWQDVSRQGVEVCRIVATYRPDLANSLAAVRQYFVRFAALVAVNNKNGYGRRLLCARCDTEWGYRRSGCPFCGQVAQWTYFPDENELFRLYGCDICRRYLKTVDWRQTFAYRSLPVARVITVGMDLAARQAGFT